MRGFYVFRTDGICLYDQQDDVGAKLRGLNTLGWIKYFSYQENPEITTRLLLCIEDGTRLRTCKETNEVSKVMNAS